MPSTVTPRIYTGAFPTIVNPIKYAIYAAADPLAEVESQTFAAPHPIRAVSFPGLDRINYILRVFEMLDGVPLRTLVNDFNFNPDNNDIDYKTPEIIVVGITPGITPGSNTFTFDGTDGKPDWRSWTPIVQPPGFAPWLEGYNYTWDTVTGTLTIIDGQTFESEFRMLVEFETKIVTGAPGIPTAKLFSQVMDVDSNITLVPDDFGKKILVNPASTYVKITLPPIATVLPLKTIFFETGLDTGTDYCVEIAANTGDQWSFGKSGRGSMFMVASESFTAYRYGSLWHVQDAAGNFKIVGDQFGTDIEEDEVSGAIPMKGQLLSVNQYARLYNDYVLKLPAGRAVPFSGAGGWASNPTKWSLASGGFFRCPDRRNIHERNADTTNLPGNPLADSVGAHQHLMFGPDAAGNDAIDATSGVSLANSDGGNLGYRLTKSTGANAANAGLSGSGTGTENFVKSYFINRFVKI